MLLILLIILIVLAAAGGFWGSPRYGYRVGWSPLVVLVIVLLIVWIASGASLP